MDKTLFAGFAKMNITPTESLPLQGYHRDSDSLGILDNLYCRIMILKQSTTTLVLLTIDNIGFTTEFTTKLRKKIAYHLTINLSQIMVCFTHTHSAPLTIGNNEQMDKRIKRYCHMVEQCIEPLIQEALNHLILAALGWDMVEFQIGINRRVHQQGYAQMGNNVTGPVDHRLPILKVMNKETEEIIGVLLRLGVHANVLKGDNLLISGDLPGWISNELEKSLHCTVLTTIGAAGNVNPLYRGKQQDLFHLTKLITTCILEKIAHIQTKSTVKLQSQSDIISVKTTELSSLLKANTLASEVQQHWGVPTEKWLAEIQKQVQNGTNFELLSMEIQTFQIGEAILSGVPAEIFAETAIKLSQQLENKWFLFGGYTNGYAGYLPSVEEFDFGGYEVDWNPVVYGIAFGRLLPFEKETETRLIRYFTKEPSLYLGEKE
ncbi:MAG: neutral/alkaline non-lysosomal ceramidase N-terminal domain-containing protein [Bacillaceae bacterium]